MLYLVSRCSCLRVAWMVLLSYQLIKNSFSSSSAIFAINVIWQLTKRSRLTKERIKILCLVKQYWISITISPLNPTDPTYAPALSDVSFNQPYAWLLLLTNLRVYFCGAFFGSLMTFFREFQEGLAFFQNSTCIRRKGKIWSFKSL